MLLTKAQYTNLSRISLKSQFVVHMETKEDFEFMIEHLNLNKLEFESYFDDGVNCFRVELTTITKTIKCSNFIGRCPLAFYTNGHRLRNNIITTEHFKSILNKRTFSYPKRLQKVLQKQMKQ